MIIKVNALSRLTEISLGRSTEAMNLQVVIALSSWLEDLEIVLRIHNIH